jgi:GntR family transcriptional repressor for pyruvate dehydrogenase complex
MASRKQGGSAATVVKTHSAVHRAAGKLRAMAMGIEEGTLLGSEEELMAKLEVSRPTLRQAAALVAQERLISIRRGVNGGYFAALPDSMTVARMAAIYLQSRHARLSEVIEAVEPIRTEIARLASRSGHAEGKAQLADFLAQERAMSHTDYRSFLRAERAFSRVLGAIGSNRVLELFLGIVYDLTGFVGREEDVYVNHPERIELYRAQRNRLAEAVLEGDQELAVIANKRCSALVSEWMHEDFEGRLGKEPIGVGAQAAE